MAVALLLGCVGGAGSCYRGRASVREAPVAELLRAPVDPPQPGGAQGDGFGEPSCAEEAPSARNAAIFNASNGAEVGGSVFRGHGNSPIESVWEMLLAALFEVPSCLLLISANEHVVLAWQAPGFGDQASPGSSASHAQRGAGRSC